MLGIQWVQWRPREHNVVADALRNVALDNKLGSSWVSPQANAQLLFRPNLVIHIDGGCRAVHSNSWAAEARNSSTEVMRPRAAVRPEPASRSRTITNAAYVLRMIVMQPYFQVRVL